MDLDRDGRADVLSGSYSPGELYLFSGIEQGFAAPRTLRDARGEALRMGRATWPFACDWDGDGDLDLVVGNMFGQVFLVRNESGGKELRLAPPAPLLVAGVALERTQTNASPCVVDWDGDGAQDLLLGQGDGSVLVYRNTAKSGAPALAAPVELVPKSPEGALELRLAHPGLRARVAIDDWNEDGRLDLVVGEYVAEDGPAPELGEEERQAQHAALKVSLELGERRGVLERAAFARWLREKGLSPDEGATRYDDFLAEWLKTPEAQDIVARQMEQAAILGRMNPAVIEHGRVWVFLRRPKEK